jgi:hypothetical protein
MVGKLCIAIFLAKPPPPAALLNWRLFLYFHKCDNQLLGCCITTAAKAWTMTPPPWPLLPIGGYIKLPLLGYHRSQGYFQIIGRFFISTMATINFHCYFCKVVDDHDNPVVAAGKPIVHGANS